MTEQSEAKVYLASERGHTETDWFRSYNTFNFGGFQNEHKQPFGPLYVWNDDTLAGGRSLQLLVEEDSFIFLLPIVGAVQYEDSKGNDRLLQAGQSFFCPVDKGTMVTLSNPYEDKLVNFLQGWLLIKNDDYSLASLISFSIDDNKNRLMDISVSHNGLRFLLGKFDGRNEGNYRPTEASGCLFAFVIQGAFEVQNRLLEARDALVLWNTEAVDFEALSNDAILLLLQLPAEDTHQSPR